MTGLAVDIRLCVRLYVGLSLVWVILMLTVLLMFVCHMCQLWFPLEMFDNLCSSSVVF